MKTIQKITAQVEAMSDEEKSKIAKAFDSSFDSGYWANVFEMIDNPELTAAYNLIFEAYEAIYGEVSEYTI